MVLSSDLSVGGQFSTGPKGVLDQSCLRIKAPISPPPANRVSDKGLGDLEAIVIHGILNRDGVLREIQKIKCPALLQRITYCADRSTNKGAFILLLVSA
jgi:hypothetical protein